MAVHKEQVIEARREFTLATSRLEHAILQAIIEHVAEHHNPREQIVMALSNVTGYWQKKVILAAITKKLNEELNA